MGFFVKVIFQLLNGILENCIKEGKIKNFDSIFTEI